MRPLGMPPPSARSSDRLPVGVVSTCTVCDSPSFIIDPLPNCFSIVSRARPRAFVLPSVAPIGSSVASTLGLSVVAFAITYRPFVYGNLGGYLHHIGVVP